MDDIEEIIENTRRRVEEMRRLTEQTTRLIDESKRAGDRLDETDQQVRHQQKYEDWISE